MSVNRSGNMEMHVLRGWHSEVGSRNSEGCVETRVPGMRLGMQVGKVSRYRRHLFGLLLVRGREMSAVVEARLGEVDQAR